MDLLFRLPPGYKWITFDGCFSGTKYLDNLFKALADNGLTGFAIRNTDMSKYDLTPLVQLLRRMQGNPTARILRRHSLCRTPFLQWLDLSGNQLGDSSAAAIITALKNNISLRGLDLSNNNICDRNSGAKSTMAALCEAESHNTETNGLLRRNTTLTSLSLANNHLTSNAISQLITTLSDNCGMLRYLDLNTNNITAGVDSIVSYNTTLVYLNLQHNQLTEVCGQALDIAMKHNTTLCFLMLKGGNRVRQDYYASCQKTVFNTRQKLYARESALCTGENATAVHDPTHDGRPRWPCTSLGRSTTFPSDEGAADPSDDGPKDVPEDTNEPETIDNNEKPVPDVDPSSDPVEEFPEITSNTAPPVPPPPMPPLRSLPPQHEWACISYLLSAPLVTIDEFRNQTTVEKLEIEMEKELLRTVLRERDKAINLRSAIATLDNFCDEMTRGCRMLHFSGHGTHDSIIFEDKTGCSKAMTEKDIKTLLRDRTGSTSAADKKREVQSCVGVNVCSNIGRISQAFGFKLGFRGGSVFYHLGKGVCVFYHLGKEVYTHCLYLAV